MEKEERFECIRLIISHMSNADAARLLYTLAEYATTGDFHIYGNDTEEDLTVIFLMWLMTSEDDAAVNSFFDWYFV